MRRLLILVLVAVLVVATASCSGWSRKQKGAAAGAGAGAVLGGLIGNILAVCSWAFLTAPIAVKVRLSLYWQLKKICGSMLVFIYNIVNALMFCFLAGAMVAVAATAVIRVEARV